MISILFFGFLLGMRHALEADHIAAVASLTSKTTSARQGIRQGMAWGLGHTLTLFLFGSLVLFVVNIIPEKIVNGLEFVVGLMLIILGIDVLHRVYKERVHFHAHTHGEANDNEKKHFHAHSHKGENKTTHNPSAHKHEHTQGFPIRALLVGLMHGMAGSAALIILTLQTMTSPWLGLIYIALFGLGSIVGMGLFSLVIVLPLRAARHMTWLYNGLQTSVGVATIALGIFTVIHTASI